MPVYYAAADRPFLTRATASSWLRGWVGRRIPEEGVLVLLRGRLEEAAPEAVVADHQVKDGDVVEDVFEVLATRATRRVMSRTCIGRAELCFAGTRLRL